MKFIKIFWSLTFIIFLGACSPQTNDNDSDELREGEEEKHQSSFKEGEIVLTTDFSEDILVVQMPHPWEPVPDGLLLIVMDRGWSGGGYFDNQNKVWIRSNIILNTGGADICRFGNINRHNLTGASIVEIKDGEVKRVVDQRIYSDNPVLLDSAVHYVKLTEGVATELTLSKGDDVFLARGNASSFRERSMNLDINILEYIDLVSAALMGGLNCSI